MASMIGVARMMMIRSRSRGSQHVRAFSSSTSTNEIIVNNIINGGNTITTSNSILDLLSGTAIPPDFSSNCLPLLIPASCILGYFAVSKGYPFLYPRYMSYKHYKVQQHRILYQPPPDVLVLKFNLRGYNLEDISCQITCDKVLVVAVLHQTTRQMILYHTHRLPQQGNYKDALKDVRVTKDGRVTVTISNYLPPRLPIKVDFIK